MRFVPTAVQHLGGSLGRLNCLAVCADLAIVSDLILWDDEPKDDDGEPVEETRLEKVR